MKIKLADDISITIPTNTLRRQLSKMGYELTDKRPPEKKISGKTKTNLDTKTFFRGETITIRQAINSMLPDFIDFLEKSPELIRDTPMKSKIARHLFTAGWFFEYLKEKQPDTILLKQLSCPAICGKLLLPFSEENGTPIWTTIIDGKRFYRYSCS